MAAFISVLDELATGRRGALAETKSNLRSCLMSESCLSGLLVVKDTGTPEGTVEGKLPASAAELLKPLGILIYQSFRSVDEDGNEIVEGRMENYVNRGTVWSVCEEAVETEDKVYVRHTANGAGKLQVGAFRNDSDGGSVVTFVVNSATNLETVSVVLDGIMFSVPGDASALTTEIATALAAEIDAHAAYACPVPGASTFVVTKGDGSDIVLGAVASSITATSGAFCSLLPSAKFASRSTGAGVAKVEVNFP